jgi:TRAP-type C4-dicarboxylate transport system permease small subunit
MIDRFMHAWNRVETVLVGFLLAIALAVFLGGSALRHASPDNAIDWAEEVSIYCIVWATVLSGSALMHERRHITTDALVSLLPAATRNAIALFVMLLTLAFCTAMAWYGWQATLFAVMLDERSASTLRTPMAYALFLALPVGMALTVLRLAVMLATGTRSISVEQHFEAPDDIRKAAGDLQR